MCATSNTFVPGLLNGWKPSDGIKFTWRDSIQTSFPWRKRPTGRYPALRMEPKNELEHAIPWHNIVVDRLGRLLPGRYKDLPDDKRSWRSALEQFHTMYSMAPNVGRVSIVYDKNEKRYLTRWGNEKSVQADAHQQLILHSHAVSSVGMPSQRDINNSYPWTQGIARTLIKLGKGQRIRLPANAVFSRTGETFEISAYWRMRNAARTVSLEQQRSWGDQVGLITFTRWDRSTQELLAADTGLLFRCEGHDRAWLSLGNLSVALREQERQVAALMLYGRETPDVAHELEGEEVTPGDDYGDIVRRLSAMAIGYRKRGFPVDKKQRGPYVTIHSQHDTLALEPRVLFTQNFEWQKVVSDNLFRNLFYALGAEWSYDDPNDKR